MTPKAKTKAEQKKADKWNATHPVGTVVDLLKDGGEVVRTHTRSAAEVLSGHTAVIWLAGIRGCYTLDRVTPVADVIPA